MHKKIFIVKDIKLGTYFTPSYAEHQTELTRALSEIVNAPTIKDSHQFTKYPQDFELFEIGTYNKQTGEITTNDKKFILNFTELLLNQGTPNE